MNAATSEPDLIPVRALNQVTYCPRLYYLEYVESVMPNNHSSRTACSSTGGSTTPPWRTGPARKATSCTRGASRSAPSGWGSRASSTCWKSGGGEVRPVEYKRSAAPNGDDGRPGLLGERRDPGLCPGLLLEEASGRSVPARHPLLHWIEDPRRGSLLTRRCEPDAGSRRAHSRTVARDVPPIRCRPSCGTAASAARWRRSACPRKPSF